MASVLRAHLDDYDLGLTIAYGQRRDKEMTVKFEELVHQMWLSEGKSADDGEHIFDPPDDLNIWTSFVTKLDKEDAYKTMVAVLKQRYSKETLAKLLGRAERVGGTKRIAEKLTQELSLSEGRTAESSFRYVTSNPTAPSCPCGVSYVQKVDGKNADQTMLSVLESYYAREDLVRLLATAKENKRSKELTDRLEQLLDSQWH